MRFAKFTTALGAFALVWMGIVSPAWAEDWPGWRGPRGDGTSTEANIPTHWSETENIAWKTPIPGGGHASPIVSGDRVFVVSCVEETTDRVLVCLDRRTGKILWQQTVITTPLEKKHDQNSFASSTPATDGRSVFVSLFENESEDPQQNRGKMVVAAYDFDGKQLWLVRPGEFSSTHGYSSCPVLFKNTIIMNGDHDGDGYLVALDKATGKTVWKVPRENHTRSYCTPIIRQFAGRTQLLYSGSLSVSSYDPNDGSRIWTIDGPTEQFVTSLVEDGELVFVTSGFPEKHVMAIRPDGTGNVTETNIVWRDKGPNCSYVPSPIVVGDYFLMVADSGILSCYETKTGKQVWRERIGPKYHASLVTAGGLVYCLSDRGGTTVVKPGPTFEKLAENTLDEECYASPAISQGQLFIRGDHHLYCIGTLEAPAAGR